MLCRKNPTTTVIASADELQSLVERGKDIAFDCVDNPFLSPILTDWNSIRLNLDEID